MTNHLWLIGMMGSGKSAVGRRLADRIGMPFHDTDDEIASRTGCSIAQLWGERGENAFRAMESAAIGRLADGDAAVIACGGGAVLDPANVAVMRSTGLVVWLTADVSTLTARVGDPSSRPLLVTDDPHTRLEAILGQRQELYRKTADATVATDGREIDEIATEIEALWTRS